MSIEVKDFNSCDYPGQVCCSGCSSSCVDVVLITDNVRIMLCEDCLKNLRMGLDSKSYKINHFCRKCAYFTPDKYEPSKHDGKCQLHPDVMCDPRVTCDKFVKKYEIIMDEL